MRSQRTVVTAAVVLMFLLCPRMGLADILRCQPSTAPFARGYCSVVHSADPEGWIRASAELDRSAGAVTLSAQVETDSILSGPRGTIAVSLLDKQGVERGSARFSKEVGRAGKSCGKADPCGISSFRANLHVPLAAAIKVTHMAFVIRQTGKQLGTAVDFSAIAQELSGAGAIGPVATLDVRLTPGTATVALKAEEPASPNDPRRMLDQFARITDGEKVQTGRYPWMAALYRFENGQFVQYCGGTLVRSSWVLTAAHCGVDKTWIVVLGRTDLSDSQVGEVDHLADVVSHKGYNSATLHDDVTLLKLEHPSAIAPIALADVSLTAGTRVFIAGWGATEADGAMTVNLRQVQVALMSQDSCSKSYPGRITSTMLCAGLPQGGKDSCQGDSGGPLFASKLTDPAAFVQYGIVSWGDGCAQAGHPGVYTDVTTVSEWISRTVAAPGIATGR